MFRKQLHYRAIPNWPHRRHRSRSQNGSHNFLKIPSGLLQDCPLGIRIIEFCIKQGNERERWLPAVEVGGDSNVSLGQSGGDDEIHRPLRSSSPLGFLLGLGLRSRRRRRGGWWRISDCCGLFFLVIIDWWSNRRRGWGFGRNWTGILTRREDLGQPRHRRRPENSRREIDGTKMDRVIII